MIENSNWFDMRKYGGWGIKPKTWQGWLYVIGMVAPILALVFLTPWSTNIRVTACIIWVLIICIDAIDIMIHIKKDERERLHEALAERNAAWFMTFAMVCGLLFQLQRSIVSDSFLIDPILVIALIGGTLTKLVTFLYLKNK